SIIQEAAGDESEIIFGAVHDPSLTGEVRVTVIATGLDGGHEEPVRDNLIRPNFGARTVSPPAAVAYAAAGGGGGVATAVPVRAPAYVEPAPFQRPPQAPIARHQLTDLDIPTFIRRQMD